MEVYKIIIIILVLLLGVVVGVVMHLALRVGKSKRADQDNIKVIKAANDTQQKLIYLLKSRSA